MKRFTGAMALFAMGLTGCISVTPAGENKKPAEARPAAKQAPANGNLPPAQATGDGVAAAVSQWDHGPTHSRVGSVDHTAARPQSPPLPPVQARVPFSPPQTQMAAVQPPPVPEPVPGQPEMPSVTTPPAERVQQAVHLQQHQDAGVERIGTIASQKIDSPARPVSVPPAPSVKATPAEPKVTATKGGAPLFRLVNTKRITLNFEVTGLGASGLSAVELWFTQDGKEWKKHDAPPKAKAYVVEVEHEGMYGFTLLARSGTGLAKEPPQPGDAPQVWVIVDLTSPEIQLTDVKPSLQANQQHVAIKWRANDKNMGRQPITLSYAESEAGPWKVIAAGLETVGTYNWEVPEGTPAKVLFRAEAQDMAGNVGRATLTRPVVMDNKVPVVNILNVGVSAQ